MPDPIAYYAAAVGTASLGWQIYREFRKLRTKLRVEFEHSAQPREGVLFAMSGEPRDPRPEPLEYELALVVVNDGETTEYVRDVWVEDAAEKAGFDFGEDEAGDKTLPPRGRVYARLRPAHVDVDLSGGFYGFARLASGRIVKSGLEHLEPVVLEHVEEWNRDARP